MEHDRFEIELNENGKILDFLTGAELEPKPEEFVRQHYLRILHFDYQYPKTVLAREIPIYYGRKQLTDREGNPVRADIVVYGNKKACESRDQGNIELIVECKAPSETDGYNQLVSYIFNTSANGAVWYNGDVKYYRRLSQPKNSLVEWIGIPRNTEAWDSLGRRKKADLKRPKDIKDLLRRCHNKLHGRGVDGEEEDLTMDMVRLILAKAIDEERPGELPEFYCTPEEYHTAAGQQAVAERIQKLFAEVVSSNPSVFTSHERISVGPRAICDVVNELQSYRMLSNLHSSDDWDIMGYAYEQYTATYLKRQKGQFFTNRLVVDFMVSVLNPTYNDIILDPAGGSGGFLTGAMRYIRRAILSSRDTDIAKERQLDKHRTNLFMVEISKRLVKIAKTAMILNGDGHAGMTQGDSLGTFEKLDDVIRARAGKEKPSIILTNPPFAGVGEGRITDPKVLNNYSSGIKWTARDGKFETTNEVNSEGVPPEMLFFERCLQWIAPGGRIGIVMPKSFLDTRTYFPVRKLLLSKYRLLGVVNCHKNTFQPHTGVRTCLTFIERPHEGEKVSDKYDIFLAISKKIGQDSEGMPIFTRDENNLPTEIIDHDLDDILADYRSAREGALRTSPYRFLVNRSELNKDLCINPQYYLPSLNQTINAVERIDSREGWSVTALGQADKDMVIFKGPRLKTENLVVENQEESTELYYTPSAVLQLKSESAKHLNTVLATPKQLGMIKVLRLQRGDILITRSGTIGRVAFATERLEGKIASDDLIRVRVKDKRLRSWIFAFLQSFAGYDQMLRNEYGSVQQHLEPRHVASILLPIPDDWSEVADILDAVDQAIEAREALESKLETQASVLERTLDNLLSQD
jgi:type I restriction enzyme M protein